jgi:hypothetical protein
MGQCGRLPILSTRDASCGLKRENDAWQCRLVCLMHDPATRAALTLAGVRRAHPIFRRSDDQWRTRKAAQAADRAVPVAGAAERVDPAAARAAVKAAARVAVSGRAVVRAAVVRAAVARGAVARGAADRVAADRGEARVAVVSAQAVDRVVVAADRAAAVREAGAGRAAGAAAVGS